MFHIYNKARIELIKHPEILIELEKYITDICSSILIDEYQEFLEDYNEASYTHAFWENYPPEDRGRSPVGDQVPWIEVGEQSIGHKLCRLIAEDFSLREPGLPSGADNRFLLASNEIDKITKGLTDSVMVFLDIKSVGARDDFEHTVISHNQVSGDGRWERPDEALTNTHVMALGRIAKHPFYPAISPIYVFYSGLVTPTIHIFIKPVYKMLSLDNTGIFGQPLSAVRVICVPNGLLLTVNPNYLSNYPGLFFPGKDDKKKTATKLRCRVSFELLKEIADWRVQNIDSSVY